MKRTDWPHSNSPHEMLYALFKAQICGRKLRLFACACCRSVWHLLHDSRSREGVELAEACSDGLVSDEQALNGFPSANAVYENVWPSSQTNVTGANLEASRAVSVALLNYALPDNAYRCGAVASEHAITAAGLAGEIRAVAEDVARRFQAEVLRCIFGNPFRRRVLKSKWLTPNAVALARTAYDQRSEPSGLLDPVRLAILADALEEAGCDDAEVLAHCRGPGPHVRGCWVLDLVLSKK